MKNFVRYALVLSIVVGATPLILTGCGGSSTERPSIPAISRTDRFTLSNGQNAVVVSRIVGESITGTLQILNAPTRQSDELPVPLPVGTSNFVGTFAPPRGFNVLGDLNGGQGQFTLNGQLPLPDVAGSYSLTVNGATANGVIPALNAR